MPDQNAIIDVHRLYQELGDILSERFGVKVTFTLRPKEPQKEKPAQRPA